VTPAGATAPRAGERGPSRRAAVATGLVLWFLYAGTASARLQPWDAAEFATAFAVFGVPHPPGTPLVVVIGRAVFAIGTPWLAGPLAAALASATCAACAGALLAWLLARRGTAPGLATAIACLAGTAGTWWTAATEPEAYAPAMALAVGMLAAGNEAARADAEGDRARAWRWRVLVAYALALAPAVHQLAWVAAPAALFLGWPQATCARVDLPWRRMVLAGLAGASAWGILLVRGGAGAPVLMGDPTSLSGLRAIATRAMYESPGWWPRQAALGWQVAMPLEYLHEQFTTGLVASVGWVPGLVSALVVAPLLVLGVRWWWRRDRALTIAWLLLFGAGTLGVAWHLNLKLGPSLGWGVVPHEAPREVRERDTFFLPGLLAFAIGVGGGLATLVRGRGDLALALAAAWGLLVRPGHDRDRLPATTAFHDGLEAVLAEAPPRGVVLAATDWDAFGLWYAQVAEGRRRDLVPVVLGLLPDASYRGRLDAGAPGLAPPSGAGRAAALRHVIAWARRTGRPVVAGPWSVATVRRGLGADSAIVGRVGRTASSPPGHGRDGDAATSPW
jgi:hypothetical protein